jgi:holo-[acyl-carrier protein] synthase
VPEPGLGLDLVDIERLERALERRPRLARRLFTEAELEFAAARRRPGPHLAVRFAAKEAAIKALGSGLAPRQVEVTGGGNVPPALKLHQRAAELASRRGVDLQVALTHTADTAAAVVLAVPRASQSV